MEHWEHQIKTAVDRAVRNERLRSLVAERVPFSVELVLKDPESRSTVVLFDRFGTTRIVSDPEPFHLVLEGEPATWEVLLSGAEPYIRLINQAHGSLKVTATGPIAAWATPVLSEFFAPDSWNAPTQWEAPDRNDLRSVSGRYVASPRGVMYTETAGQTGPVVILIHTAGREAKQWLPVMTQLAGEAQLFAPDLPGRGRTDPLTPDGTCLDSVEELTEWISEFATSLGVTEYVVAGCSLGGNLSLSLAANDERVRGVLALQGADHTPTISASSLAAMTDPLISLPHANMNFSMSLVGSDTADEPRARIQWGVRTLNPVAQQADLTAYTTCDIRHRMGEIQCPVILFRGEDDWVVSEGMVEETAARITHASHLEVRSVPGLGHFPHVEDPDLVSATIRELLQLAQVATTE